MSGTSKSTDAGASPDRGLPAGAGLASGASASWTGSHLLVAGSSVVLATALFLPWFSVRIGSGAAAISGTADGPRAHGFLWIVVPLALTVLAILMTRPILARLPASLPNAGQLLTGATGLTLLLTVLGFGYRPTLSLSGPFALTLNPTRSGGWAAPVSTISVGWSYGAFISVVAAAVAFGAVPAAGRCSPKGQRRLPAANESLAAGQPASPPARDTHDGGGQGTANYS